MAGRMQVFLLGLNPKKNTQRQETTGDLTIFGMQGTQWYKIGRQSQGKKTKTPYILNITKQGEEPVQTGASEAHPALKSINKNTVVSQPAVKSKSTRTTDSPE